MAYVEYVENFNHNMKVLTRDLARRFPNDAIASRIQKRVAAITAIDPIAIIDMVGPKIYEYRERIYSEDDATVEEFALNYNFAEEVKKSEDAEDADTAAYLIPLIQKNLRISSSEEKKGYRKILVNLLDDFIEYLAEKP